MASLNIFGKPQKPAKEEEYDSSYYSTEEEYTAAPEVEEKPVYDNKPTAPQPEKKQTHFHDGDFVPDVTQLDLRRLYLVENSENGEKFKKIGA